MNLNLWITPDEANMDPSTGGITVWDYNVDTEKEFELYQSQFGEEQLSTILREFKTQSISIPYKRNRFVLFDSNRVHETSAMHFKSGHKNRRINLTWLFGDPSWVKRKETQQNGKM